MAIAVVEVVAGGLPISIAANGRGLPVQRSVNGFGLAVTVVAAGGLPVVDAGSGLGTGIDIELSNSLFPAGSLIGTLIGALSVMEGVGSYTFTLTDNAGGRVAITGSTLRVGGTASPVPTTFPITVLADNGAGSTKSKVFTITVV